MKEYRGMYKMYFESKDKKNVATMAMSMRDSVSAITPNFAINGHPCFILYCDEILHELSEIRNINLYIDRCSSRLPSVARRQFLRQAIIEEIHQTNEMENIHSTRKEIKDELIVVENGQKGKRFDGMIRKYQLLLQKDRIPLQSCLDIRELYNSFVLDEVVKEDFNDAPDGVYFRKGTVSVVKGGHSIHDGIYPEVALNEAMEHALQFLNDANYDPLIRISAFHYMFGYAHPFYNGNGRMTRFISSCMLSQENIHLLVALRLSFVIKSHRTEYYKMFKTTNDKRNFGDMTRFVISFLSFIREASEQVFLFLQEKESLLNHYSDIVDRLILEQKTKEVLFILIQVSICESDSLSISELSNICDSSLYIIRKCLSQIEGYTIYSQKGRASQYRANLEALDTLE
ncbi:MAG: Fic family protein [Clostridia bacterium]|nr:Fic family protein [Clostridia bacterium]